MNAFSKALCLALLAVACVSSTNVQADPFIMPPETYAPVWETSFPYQRNINMDFNVNPVAAPGSGIPGAVYEGYLDPTLKVSDYVTLTGDAQWYESVSGFTQTGFLGIDNRNGTSTLYGSLTFHIDNTENPDNEKHLWEEFNVLETNGGFGFGVRDPLGNSFELIYTHGQSTLRNFTYDLEFVHTPNPPWENVNLGFSVAPGTYILFNNFHIATECVPEPATITLLGIGAISLLAYTWRRRYQTL
jgi:hypothetical protein